MCVSGIITKYYQKELLVSHIEEEIPFSVSFPQQEARKSPSLRFFQWANLDIEVGSQLAIITKANCRHVG